MSTQPFRLRIRINDKEIELSGSRDEVMKALDDLSIIVNKVSEAFTLTSTTSRSHAHKLEGKKTVEEDILPTVIVSSGASCPEVITKILATKWGKKKPRTLSDLLEIMKINAIHYPIGTIKGRLTDLTKKGVLRRIHTNKGYGYILIKSLK